MAIFLTGATGYLGSYLVAGLLTEHRDTLNLLVRAKTEQEARERLWTSLQLHFAFPEFLEILNTRVRIFRGNLTSDLFGLSDYEYHALVDSTDSLIDRKSTRLNSSHSQISYAVFCLKKKKSYDSGLVHARAAPPSST